MAVTYPDSNLPLSGIDSPFMCSAVKDARHARRRSAGCAWLRAAARWPPARLSFDGLRAFRDSEIRYGAKNRVLPVRTKNVGLRAMRCGGANGGVNAGADAGAFAGVNAGADRPGWGCF